MKSYALAGILVATLTGAPAFTPTAAAQVATSGSSSSYMVPIVVGAAAGATVGALLWPAMVPAGAAAAAAPAASGWGWGAFLTTRAAIGAVIGGGLGFIAAH
jgi:hypothetical protein